MGVKNEYKKIMRMTSSSPEEDIERNKPTKNLTETLFSDITEDDDSSCDAGVSADEVADDNHEVADDNHDHVDNSTKSDREDMFNRKIETKSGSHFGSDI